MSGNQKIWCRYSLWRSIRKSQSRAAQLLRRALAFLGPRLQLQVGGPIARSGRIQPKGSVGHFKASWWLLELSGHFCAAAQKASWSILEHI
jgi:hypothetical protein